MAEPRRALEVPARTGTIYPPPYDAALAGRAKRAGDGDGSVFLRGSHDHESQSLPVRLAQNSCNLNPQVASCNLGSVLTS